MAAPAAAAVPASFGFAILGTGMISRDMRTALRNADNSVFLAAVGSRHIDQARAFASDRDGLKPGFPAPLAFGSYREAIEHPSVRAVYVALPTALEEEFVMAAFHAGKHVLADKPFVDSASVARMTKKAAESGLLFMDATHFVHCARTAMIRAKLAAGVIGEVQSLVATFFCGESKDGNIRLDPALEPAGAVGDLGWYTARAAIEYLVPDAAGAAAPAPAHVVQCQSSNVKGKNGAVVQGFSLVRFSNNTTLVSSVGFTGGWEQSLRIIGSRGTLHVDDFVLDQHNSGVFQHPWLPLKFEVFTDTGPLPAATYNIQTPFGANRAPRELMFEAFARDAVDKARHAQWAKRSLRTQELVDAMFHGAAPK